MQDVVAFEENLEATQMVHQGENGVTGDEDSSGAAVGYQIVNLIL